MLQFDCVAVQYSMPLIVDTKFPKHLYLDTTRFASNLNQIKAIIFFITKHNYVGYTVYKQHNNHDIPPQTHTPTLPGSFILISRSLVDVPNPLVDEPNNTS